MQDRLTYELRRLIERNREMELRLVELQAAIGRIRTDFDRAVARRLTELDERAAEEPIQSAFLLDSPAAGGRTTMWTA